MAQTSRRFFALCQEADQTGCSQVSDVRGYREFMSGQNDNPKPFRWTNSADDILAAIDRFCRSGH
jgi:hypothetical protein